MPLVKKYQIVKLELRPIMSDSTTLDLKEITSYQNPFSTMAAAENALSTIKFPGTFTIWKIYIQS